MPWVDIGRFTFDLAGVVLVERGVEKGAEGERSVSVFLKPGMSFDLGGEDAQVFAILFGEYKATRSFGPPTPCVTEPEPLSRRPAPPPGKAEGGNGGGGLSIHPAGDQ